MNVLTIILNRVYYFLTKVKNQSPLLGTIGLVSLLLNSLFFNLVTFIYTLNDKSLKINGIVYFFIWGAFFLMVYFYATKRKAQIVEVKLSNKSNFLVVGIFLFALISFIWCANVNREKLSKEKSEIIVKPPKESLEGKIRKLFE